MGAFLRAAIRAEGDGTGEAAGDGEEDEGEEMVLVLEPCMPITPPKEDSVLMTEALPLAARPRWGVPRLGESIAREEEE